MNKLCISKPMVRAYVLNSRKISSFDVCAKYQRCKWYNSDEVVGDPGNVLFQTKCICSKKSHDCRLKFEIVYFEDLPYS